MDITFITNKISKPSRKQTTIGTAIAIGALLCAAGTYAALFTPTMRPHISIDTVNVGYLSKEKAQEKLEHELTQFDYILIPIEQEEYKIATKNINLSFNSEKAINEGWSVGRSGTKAQQLQERLTSLLTPTKIQLEYTFDQNKLEEEIKNIAQQADTPVQNIDVIITEETTQIITDVAPGAQIQQDALYSEIEKAISLRAKSIEPQKRHITLPTVTLEEARITKTQIENLLATALIVSGEGFRETIPKTTLGNWLTTTPNNERLTIDIRPESIEEYLKTIEEKVFVAAVEPKITIEDGKVTDFKAPKTGRALDVAASQEQIAQTLEKRINEENKNAQAELTITSTTPELNDPTAKELGIEQLIGVATTTFTGSPSNRRWNIATGAQYLNGHLIKPGEEFTTTGTLGYIGAETGYKSELVIKGDRTIPEYGGGLCQVSTTLFRAVLDAGLPVTARKNHSYRVGYYEKDGYGNYIGPGLDATIYSPYPDFRFKNDTTAHVLLASYVQGDYITFYLYGKKDGRTSHLDGPYQTSSTPAGEPIYVETDELEPGVTKKIESAHNGGTAVATYTITYADGHQDSQVFSSTYRNWPARYLVGKEPGEPNPETPLAINPEEQELQPENIDTTGTPTEETF